MKTLAERVLFISQGHAIMGSVRLRCITPARLLGAKCIVGRLPTAKEIEGRDIFILVKAPDVDRYKLQEHGAVVWDAVDDMPPSQCINHFIFSTQHALDFAGYSSSSVIYHPHALGAGPVVPTTRTPYWIGGTHWKPKLNFEHVTVNTNFINEHKLNMCYREAGILVNVRKKTNSSELHCNLNSGIKLINAISYAIPSITDDEPWVREIGGDCTIISSDWAADIQRLKDDNELYEHLRQKCLERRIEFSHHKIRTRYEEVLNSIGKS